MSVKKPLAIDQPRIGKLIRELRIGTGLSQERFASEIGVTCSSKNRWENGRSKPLPLARQKILQYLDQMGEQGRELLDKYSAE